MKKLYQRLVKNPLNFKTKSKTVLENLQKATLLSFFSDNLIKHELIMEKPIAVILDNYSVHHTLFFTILLQHFKYRFDIFTTIFTKI